MPLRRFRLWLALGLLVLAVILLVAASLPQQRSEQVMPMPPVMLPTITPNDGGDTPETGGPEAPPAPTLLEQRNILLEWPERIREKDSDRVELTIAMDPQPLVTATPGDAPIPGEQIPVDIPNIYETHNLVAAARLDIAGMEAIREEIREPLQPGQDVTFRWSVRANEAGLYRGVVWLHLELVPKDGGAVERVLLMARPIDIQAVTVFGMSGTFARTLGVLGLIASTLLGYPLIQRLLDPFLKPKPPLPPPTTPPPGDSPPPGSTTPPAA